MSEKENILSNQLQQAQKRLEMLEQEILRKEEEISELKDRVNKQLADADLIYIMLCALLQELSEEEEYLDLLYSDGASVNLLNRIQTLLYDLKQDKYRAETHAQLKSDFLANMSHEIRTPINGIVGVTRLLKSTQIDAKQNEYLKAIESSSDILMAVINDILDISKIEAGKIVIEEKVFSLPQVLSSALELFEVKAAEKKIELKRDFFISDLPEFLMGDAVRLNQVLYNLLGNAIKFTSEGEVGLSVEQLNVLDGNVNLRIKVWDTGIGIPKHLHTKVFNAFSQANSSTTRKFGGTGLGLTIVKRLVELQGGRIYLESDEGKGASFIVELKYRIASQETLPAQIVHQNDYYELRGKTVLLVEDNPVNQLVGKDLLEAEGVEVIIAENGQEAIEVIQNNSFDLILMDMQMPVMDGYTAIRKIRNELLLKNLPILSLTAHVSKEELDRCMEVGATDYLSKPYLPSDLFGKMIKMMSLSPSIPDSSNHSFEKERKEVSYMDSLLNYVGGNEKLAQKIKSKIETELPKDLEEMVMAWESVMLEEVGALAHKIKPNMQMLGADELYEMVYDLETKMKNKQDYKEEVFFDLVRRVREFINMVIEE